MYNEFKEDKTMTINEVREILTGTFYDEADRQYWVDKLHEMEIKEATGRENARTMAKLRRQIHYC